MNDRDSRQERFSDELFDRLVDGELPEAQRRELLGRLDDEPNGWRRCAMAFLEAQCFEEGLGALLAEEVWPDTPAKPSPTVTPGPPRFWRRASRHLGTVAAMAASFLVALSVGLYWQNTRPAAAPVHHVAGEPAPAVATENATGTSPLQRPSSPWQMVTLAGNKDSGPIQLPAVEKNSIDEDDLRSLPVAVPSELFDSLRKAGHDVKRSRQYVPIRLQDGRRLVVPVDQYDVLQSKPDYQ